MRIIDADDLVNNVKANMTTDIFKAIDIITNQPTIEPSKLNTLPIT